MADFTKLKEFDEAIALINESKYYGDLIKGDLMGTQVYGMLEGKELVACVVIIGTGVQAYLDYLCVAPAYQRKKVGTVLLAKTIADLHKQGVCILHACISGENGGSMELMKAYKPKIGWPFMNVVVDLEEYNG